MLTRRQHGIHQLLGLSLVCNVVPPMLPDSKRCQEFGHIIGHLALPQPGVKLRTMVKASCQKVHCAMRYCHDHLNQCLHAQMTMHGIASPKTLRTMTLVYAVRKGGKACADMSSTSTYS